MSSVHTSIHLELLKHYLVTCRVTNGLAFNQVYRGPQKPVPCLVSRLRAFKKKVDLRKKMDLIFSYVLKEGHSFISAPLPKNPHFLPTRLRDVRLLPSRQNYTLLDLVNFHKDDFYKRLKKFVHIKIWNTIQRCR